MLVNGPKPSTAQIFSKISHPKRESAIPFQKPHLLPRNFRYPLRLSVMLMAINLSFSPHSLIPFQKPSLLPRQELGRFLQLNSVSRISNVRLRSGSQSGVLVRAALDSDYSSKRSSSNEERETFMLPGCDYNHWLIVMEFPKDPAPTREQMIDTYLNTLATVLGRFSLNLSRFCSL